MLVPEIALTPQLAGRFRARFGDDVALMHSGLSDAERHAEWLRLRRGEAHICVGVRSAVFAPVQDLAVLVVDEEHDGSFKQEDGPPYHARDLAVVRAKLEDAVLVLGSATPSLETLDNARPRPLSHALPACRASTTGPCPRSSSSTSPACVDLGVESTPRPHLAAARGRRWRRRSPPASRPSSSSTGAATRRWWCARPAAPRRAAPTAPSSLTHHARRGLLLCHYCGRDRAACPRAARPAAASASAWGWGPSRWRRRCARSCPRARVARLDRDAVSSADDTAAVLARFANRELDVLVGTQMVTKGHDFPGVTLVGVILADTALALPDFRAAERTFQLLAQVAGRAGRGADAGRCWSRPSTRARRRWPARWPTTTPASPRASWSGDRPWATRPSAG